MADGKRKVDIAFILRTKDENGRLFTRPGPDGTPIPDPIVQTINYNMPDNIEVRASLWDLDNERLYPLLPTTDGVAPTPEQHDDFFQLMHARMQGLATDGTVARLLAQHVERMRELTRPAAANS